MKSWLLGLALGTVLCAVNAAALKSIEPWYLWGMAIMVLATIAKLDY